MSPLIWVSVAVAGGALGIAVYVVKGASTSPLDRLRAFGLELTDRIAPLDEDRALDRVDDEVARAVARSRHRGVLPGLLTVSCGSGVFAALGGDAGQQRVKATAQGSLAKLNPPVVDSDRVLVTLRLNDELDPGQVTVSVAPRTKSLTPMPGAPEADGARRPAASEPRRTTWRVSLQSLTEGIPSFEVRPDRALLIGRENSDLLLPESSARLFAGRQHAEILAESRARRVSVTDKASRNGTFVNGRQVDAAELENGDQLNLGDVSWVVSIGGPR